MTYSRTEKKMGKRILEVVAEMRTVPRENVQRFIILKRRLTRLTNAYREFTGKDRLEFPIDYYGYRQD